MRTVRTRAQLRDTLAEARRTGATIGLVATMGAFHEGHLSLMRRARADCDVVVVSLFVNPTQFDDSGDLERYPRDERRDAALAAELGIDLLFAPASGELYPPGFATTVSVRGITEGLEGAHRGRGHFDGVTTVVTKLLLLVAPDLAYFGQKDAQQLVVIRRLVRDLEIPARIVACPTVRAGDGLALSSRNALLSAEDRPRASALSRALAAMQRVNAGGSADAREALAAGRAELAAAGVVPEYLEIVSAETLEPVARVDRPALALVAARVGPVRLIDNAPLAPAPQLHNTHRAVATPERAPTT